MKSKMMAVYIHWYAEIVNAGLQPSQRHYLAWAISVNSLKVNIVSYQGQGKYSKTFSSSNL